MKINISCFLHGEHFFWFFSQADYLAIMRDTMCLLLCPVSFKKVSSIKAKSVIFYRVNREYKALKNIEANNQKFKIEDIIEK